MPRHVRMPCTTQLPSPFRSHRSTQLFSSGTRESTPRDVRNPSRLGGPDSSLAAAAPALATTRERYLRWDSARLVRLSRRVFIDCEQIGYYLVSSIAHPASVRRTEHLPTTPNLWLRVNLRAPSNAPNPLVTHGRSTCLDAEPLTISWTAGSMW